MNDVSISRTFVLGEIGREALTPEYLKAQARVQYASALFGQDYHSLREAEEVLKASERDLQREIGNMVAGFSTEDLGRALQRLMLELASFWTEVLASPPGSREIVGIPTVLPAGSSMACRLQASLLCYQSSSEGRGGS